MNTRSVRMTMLSTMARMQDAHNRQVHPDWRHQGYPYYRAIWVECAELLDHFGWKWWKHQQPDLDQVKLELVDIWHFGISELLRSGTWSEDVVDAFDVAPGDGEPESFRRSVEYLAASTLQQRTFVLSDFVATMNSLPMTFDELYRLYVGKNVLNHFRQDNGYQQGTYRKQWKNREDNEHLIDLLETLDVGHPEAPERLYAALSLRYTINS